MDESLALWCARTAETPGMLDWDPEMFPLPDLMVSVMSVLLETKVWMGGIRYTTRFNRKKIDMVEGWVPTHSHVMVVRHEDQGLLKDAESWRWTPGPSMVQWMLEEEVNRCFGIIHKKCNTLHLYG